MSKIITLFLSVCCLCFCIGCGTLQHSNPYDPLSPVYGPPATPTGLSASAGDTTISLSWTANSESDLSKYNIYRSTSSGSGFVAISSTIAGTVSYDDTGLTNGLIYYYKITAVDIKNEESSFSSVASATPVAPPPPPAPPSAPTNVSTLNDYFEVSVRWDANPETNIAGYNVYRSATASGVYTKMNPSLISGSEYWVHDYSAFGTYYFKVTAVNTSGIESGFSSVITGRYL